MVMVIVRWWCCGGCDDGDVSGVVFVDCFMVVMRWWCGGGCGGYGVSSVTFLD